MGNHQSQFMYMFERLNEPLYFGPRGSQNAYFNIEQTWMDESTKKTANLIRNQLAQSAIVSRSSFDVKAPRVIPNLNHLERSCKKNDSFSLFLPSHNRAANDLITMLIAQPNREDFLNMCAYTRDSPKVNSQLWVHAVSSAALRRPDMRGFRVPAIWEILPETFVPTQVIEAARVQAALPSIMRSVLKVHRFSPTPTLVGIDENFSSNSSKNPENRLWYFREDLGLSSHHWHWHLVYNNPATRPGSISRDRKGELFYYMHRNVLQRYNAERICNNLPLALPLDLTNAPILEEGYFPKLTVANAGRNWPARQDYTRIYGAFRTEENSSSEDMRKWKDRLLNAIETGFVISANGAQVRLTPSNGIDILGGLVENGGYASLNSEYYGNIHDVGHNHIAYSHDPYDKYNEGMGVMADTVTATKDPAFYRWHTFIDNLFETYKQTLPPYTENELIWPGVQILKAGVEQRSEAKNVLATCWMESDIDLTRGLDLRRTSAMNQGPVWARVTHLTHERFNYNLTVQNHTRVTLPATLRIFMAPSFDENKCPIPFKRQRTLFFEMDKVYIRLAPGRNRIVHSSLDSAVTVPWEQSFQDLENYIDMNQLDDVEGYCGCGWPQHLLLPKGSKDGIIFDLFFMLTDGTKDAVPINGDDCPRCKLSIAFCGILDELYPDAKAMGFPFDRIGRSANYSGSGSDLAEELEDFIPKNSNMAAIKIKIINRNTVSSRGNGAPSSMKVMDIFGAQGNKFNSSSIKFEDHDQSDSDSESSPSKKSRVDSDQSSDQSLASSSNVVNPN